MGGLAWLRMLAESAHFEVKDLEMERALRDSDFEGAVRREVAKRRREQEDDESPHEWRRLRSVR